MPWSFIRVCVVGALWASGIHYVLTVADSLSPGETSAQRTLLTALECGADLSCWCLVSVLVLYKVISILCRRVDHASSNSIMRGGMLVVPNRECDIFSRFWCVYEIFAASELRLDVRLAHTLSYAGRIHTKEAKCRDQADEEHIRSDIAASNRSYRDLDRAVFITTHTARWHVFASIVFYGALLHSYSMLSRYISSLRLALNGGEFHSRASLLTLLLVPPVLLQTLILYLIYATCRFQQGFLRLRSILTLLIFLLFVLVSGHTH